QAARALRQIGGWLAGPSESIAMAPLNAAAILVLVRVALWRGAEPWLRLTAFATLAQHGVALFYPGDGRYHYLTWLLTLLVVGGGGGWAARGRLHVVARCSPPAGAGAPRPPPARAPAGGPARLSEMRRRGRRRAALGVPPPPGGGGGRGGGHATRFALTTRSP